MVDNVLVCCAVGVLKGDFDLWGKRELDISQIEYNTKNEGFSARHFDTLSFSEGTVCKGPVGPRGLTNGACNL